ncbi:MAG TPA: hypothetical protein VI072_23895 [Polyangiaceae bacterium]
MHAGHCGLAETAQFWHDVLWPTFASSLAIGALLCLPGCGAGTRPFPARDPIWVDTDQRPFRPAPEESFSPLYWDATDRSLLQPLSRTFSLEQSREAENVNALDEVPDSSWFRNRLGARRLRVDAVARGACELQRLQATGTWVVVDGKPDGANPGLTVRAPDGNRYLLKFDGKQQPERASAGDLIGSRLYYAAGFDTPCNEVVWLDPSQLRLAPSATAKMDTGRERPLTHSDVKRALLQAARSKDGRVRASASRFFEDKPLGPWKYDGTRSDDPNDVVPHEDRREVRGSYLLAAWLDHVDARDQNTLSLWRRLADGRGYVRHAFIDWGDCLGQLWGIDPAQMPRQGHAYFFDLPQIAADYITFGMKPRVWDDARLGPGGKALGYYDGARFDPDDWKPHYPNPAFVRRTEADMAWMARIIANVSDEMLDALVLEAQIADPVTRQALVETLRHRRDKLLLRFLSRKSPLSWPTIDSVLRRPQLCLTDLALRARVVTLAERRYSARVLSSLDARPERPALVRAPEERICVDLSAVQSARPLVEVSVPGFAERWLHARVHLYRTRAGSYRVAGLERVER